MAHLPNLVLSALLIAAPAATADRNGIAGSEIESQHCTGEQATDSQSMTMIWLLFTLICSGDTCHHADYAPPLAFRSKASCISFAVEAHKQDMPYACEPATWGDASETGTRKML